MRRADPKARCVGVSAAAAAAAALLFQAPATGRPYTVEDLVRQESFGQVAFDPTGTWLAYERRGPHLDAPSFAHEGRPDAVENRIRVVEVARSVARPLLADDPMGLTLGPFSPDGRRLAVYRLHGEAWDLGVVTLADGRARWFQVGPEFPARSRTVQWLSPTTLAVIARPAGSLPRALRIDAEGPRRLPGRWADAAAGRPAATLVGSGRYLGARPQAAGRRLLELDAETGRIRVLAEGAFEDLEASPDGRRIALVEGGEDIPLRADRPVNGAFGTATRRERLAILDLESGRLDHPAPGWDVAGQLLSWSPSGRRLLIFARPDGAAWEGGVFFQLTATRGLEPLDLADGEAWQRIRPEVPRALWLGETPAVLVRRGSRLDWVAAGVRAGRLLTASLAKPPETLQPVPGGAVGLADGRAWFLGPRGLRPLAGRTPLAPLARRPSQAEARLAFNPPAVQPYAEAAHVGPGGPAAAWLTADGISASIPLPDPLGEVVAGAPTGDGLAAVTADDHGVEELQLWDGRGWGVVDTVNRRLADVAPLHALRIAHAGPGGAVLDSWLYLPAPRAGGRPPPLVVLPYPGQTFRSAQRLSDWNQPYLTPKLPVIVGAGYAVLRPSLPLTPGQDPVAGLADRVLDIVDAAARQYPGAFDPDRLALWGHSYGGYGVLAILTQTDRFRAAIDQAGPVDMASAWGTFLPHAWVDPSDGLSVPGVTGWAEDDQGRMGGPPWAAPERYRRNSPLFQADRITTPLMIVQGDQDPNVPITQSEEIFSALYRQGRDALFVTYWGEGHFIQSPGNARDLHERAFAWLAAHLDGPLSAGAPPSESPRPASATSAPRPR